MINLLLFATFFKIGLTSIGGGYAMIPMIQQDVIAHGWITQSELVDFIAISESTPGPFAVNIATFIGMSQNGLLGALCSTLGVILPSFLIILIIAKYFPRFQENIHVRSALDGVRPAVVGLIASAALSIFLAGAMGGIEPLELFDFSQPPPVSLRTVLIAAVVFALSRWKKRLHPIWLIAVSGLLGYLFHAFLPTII